MISKNYIVFLGAILLTGCATNNVAPLDDAYYWPDPSAPQTHTHSDPSTPSTPSTSSTPSTPSTPGTPGTPIEYTNVQDTTVTIKIKR